MSHVALFSPYLPKHNGGGEKYLLSIAEYASRNHPTSILAPVGLAEEMQASLPRYEETFGLDLSKVSVIGSSVGSQRSPIKTMALTKRYSHLFAITDGSFFPTLCPHSYLIVQVPWTRGLSLSEKLKLNTWENILVYSDFVKDVLKFSWQTTKIKTLAPYVDLDQFQMSQSKDRIILNVGRFFHHTTSNSKRQDVVIDAFKRLVDKGVLSDYSLVLIGNIDPNSDSIAYLEKLKAAAFGYHINFLTDVPFKQLQDYYSKAKYYWHAAGFGVNPKEHPENTEHFGITTLEAMASGCIPLVVPYGGQREVVEQPRFFWETIDELYEKMYELETLSQSKLSKLAENQRAQAKKYSKTNFEKELDKLLI